jgi:hypothetical protein
MAILTDPFERAEALKVTHGHWIVASLETHLPWPPRAQVARYEGREFLLLPAVIAEGKTPDNPFAAHRLPAIAIETRAHRISDAQARVEIMRFASALAWHEYWSLEVVFWTGGNLPRQMGRSVNQPIQGYLDTELLPSPPSEAARTALALYREGTSLENPFYAFLSLYKAFSVAIPAIERESWMARKHELRDERARNRLQELESAGRNVGDYLFQEGRHAVAHADREPFVNPDSTDDHFRLRQDVPLMRSYAEIAIEEALGVPRRQTLWRQHLYELEGFRALLPSGIAETLKRGEEVPPDVTVQFPSEWLILAARGAEQQPLPGMELVGARASAGKVGLMFHSRCEVTELVVELDFVGERLIFDPLGMMSIRPLRAAPEQIEEEIQAERFRWAMILNGRIELWDAESERCLGRSEAYIPVNMMANKAGFDARIAELEALLPPKGAPATAL